MSEILKELDQIKVEVVKLNLDRDNLIEWLLQNMEDDTIARLYVGSRYALVGIDKEDLDAAQILNNGNT